MSGFFSGSLDPFWPHVALLTTAIAASFAVAVGIVMENPKWSLPNVLVVGGVAIEAACTILLFGFDEGISNAQQRTIEQQQGKIITLEKEIAPRRMTADQQSSITKSLASFAGKSVRLESYGLDVEAAILGRQLRAAIFDAHLGTNDALMTRVSGGSIALGIHVSGKDDALVKALVAAMTAADLLAIEGDQSSEHGFATFGAAQPIGPPPDALVFVGVKPVTK